MWLAFSFVEKLPEKHNTFSPPYMVKKRHNTFTDRLLRTTVIIPPHVNDTIAVALPLYTYSAVAGGVIHATVSTADVMQVRR